ncbi:MAG: hydroxyacylglutathione hydrolase [bacterium]|jgi:hydroxyacylglutathione hydrolase
MSEVDITTFPVAPLGCNCSIIVCKNTKEAIVVDPGGEATKILAELKKRNVTVKWIIHTHAHFDHCLATDEVTTSLRAEQESSLYVAMHKDDFFLWENLGQQCQWFGVPPQNSTTKIDHHLQDEEFLAFGNTKLTVLHTPGHSPGSCCFNLENTGTMFSGDTLFQMGVGRTDLPGGDSDQLIKSVKNRLFTLDGDTKVIPGHGDLTQIGIEKKQNPFF